MAVLAKLRVGYKSEIQFLECRRIVFANCLRLQHAKQDVPESAEEEFRVLQVKPPPERVRVRKEKIINLDPPRTKNMPTNQDWANVWPAQRTFHPAVVPLPIRQGYNKHGPPPSKFANVELMKIPNFLHLTPPAIKKHCEALKKFCTQWPKSLETNDDIENNFPVEVITSDYCHSSPSIRNPLARIVTLQIKLRSLNLDKHAKDKFLRLVGERYDPNTDYVTITTDSCPTKKQNYDYAHYLLTALMYESWKYEDWEKSKGDDDMEEYIFHDRKSFKNVQSIFEYGNKEIPDVAEFSKAVEEWQNKGDSKNNIDNYKNAALKLLSLTPLDNND